MFLYTLIQTARNKSMIGTEKELNEDILALITEIQTNQPELIKYLSELQESLPAYKDPKVNIKYLERYYQSLIEIRDRYTLEQEVSKRLTHERGL